ncbi:MAG: ATP-binding cassette domain-containing protein [Sulfolobales archaeon]
MIRFNILRAGYRSKEVLKEVEGWIRDGETILIIGRSGSGKTTLMLSLTGVLKNLLGGFTEGLIDLGGLDPLNYEDYREVPRRIGLALQDPDKQISMPTAWDELSFTLENLGFSSDEIESRVGNMLRRLSLYEKAFEEIENLSSGEKRRITFASALIHDPEIVILDEPTASVDPWGVKEVRLFTEEIRRSGRTTIIIEHKPEYFMNIADKILIMDRGRIISSISSEELDRELSRYLEPEREMEEFRSCNKDSATRKNGKILEVRNLSIGYRDKVLLEDIDLEFYREEIIALIGPNGSGKTTLMKTIIGWLKPLEGSIYLESRIAERKDLLRSIFYTPQQPDYLFISNSVEKELSAIRRTPMRSDENYLRIFPWYEEFYRESPFKLSHGQRKALSLLISFLYDREILLLDEPTAGIDPDLYRRLRDLLLNLRREGRLVIISTHDYRIIRDLADRVLLINPLQRKIEEIDCFKALELLRGAGK